MGGVLEKDGREHLGIVHGGHRRRYPFPRRQHTQPDPRGDSQTREVLDDGVTATRLIPTLT